MSSASASYVTFYQRLSFDNVTLFSTLLSTLPILNGVIGYFTCASNYNLSWKICTITGWVSFTHIYFQYLSIYQPDYYLISPSSSHSKRLAILLSACCVLFLGPVNRQSSTQDIHITSSPLNHLKYRYGYSRLRVYFINLNDFSNSFQNCA